MPEPTVPPTLADRFWTHAPGPETEDIPEPARSAMVVKNFLVALDHLDQGGTKDAPILAAMLRRAEVEGDPSYASPEQIRGEMLTARSIIFSLGVVLFERLTGRHPFGAENNRPRRVERIRRGEMGSGVNSFPTIPAGLRGVLVRAMSPFSEERWNDLHDFRKALRSFNAEVAPPKLPGSAAPAEPPVAPPPVPPAVPPPPAPHIPSRLTTEPISIVMGPPPIPRKLKATPEARARAAIAEAEPTLQIPRESRASRGGLYAMAGAIVGAAITLAIVFTLRPPGATTEPGTAAPPAAVAQEDRSVDPPTTTAEPPPTTDPPTTIARAPAAARPPAAAPPPAPSPATPPVVPPTPPPPAPPPTPPTPAASPPPPATPPPAPDKAAATAPAPAPGTAIQKLVAMVTPCLEPAPHPRMFGLSVLYQRRAAVKPYFGAADPVSHEERTCIAAAIHGLTGTGAPVTGVVQYVVRGGSDGVTINVRR